MATRKRSGTRRKTTRARTRKTTTRRNPSLSLTRRHSRRGSVASRSRRRSVSRRRNPSGKLVPLIVGAGLAQLGAGLLSRFGISGGPLIEAAKVAGVGWALEKFLGRTVPTAFGEARDGGFIAGGVLLFNAYLAGPLGGALNSVLPSGGNGKGVNGIALTQYPFAPQLNAPMAAPAPQKRGVNGMATAGYPFR